MGWFNYYGLIAVVIILIPNIIYAALNKSEHNEKLKSRFFNLVEQVGRYGCMAFMIFNIPYTYLGFWFENALIVYLAVNGALLIFYCIGWAIYARGNSLVKAIWLSVTPSVIFVFSGIVCASAPLIVCAVLFAAGHITISVKNSER